MRGARIAARFVGLLGIASVSLLVLSNIASAQEAASKTPPAAAQTEPPRIVSRTILPDGTVQIEYADGTTRRIAPQAGSGSSPSSAEMLLPDAPPGWLKDSPTNESFLEAMREYYRYRTSGLRHRSRVFEWQLASSKVIFATVLMLVGAGMVFAAIQFRDGLKRPVGDKAEAATQIDLSTSGVKVTSSVLGVIILVISLAFFYLYLVYVYPISEIV